MDNNQVAHAFAAKHPELSNLGPMVDAHNSQRLSEILEHNNMAMTLENLEAAYVTARTQGLLMFHHQQTIENHVLSQPHIKTEQIRSYYESQEPRKQNMADFLPVGNSVVVNPNLSLDLSSPEVKVKSDPTVYYGDVLRRLSEHVADYGHGPDGTDYPISQYLLQKRPEYRGIPRERQEKAVENMVDLMLANGDPWTPENALRRLAEVEADDAARWHQMEEQGHKVPEPPAFKPLSDVAERDHLQTLYGNGETEAIKLYLQQKYAQP